MTDFLDSISAAMLAAAPEPPPRFAQGTEVNPIPSEPDINASLVAERDVAVAWAEQMHEAFTRFGAQFDRVLSAGFSTPMQQAARGEIAALMMEWKERAR